MSKTVSNMLGICRYHDGQQTVSQLLFREMFLIITILIFLTGLLLCIFIIDKFISDPKGSNE